MNNFKVGDLVRISGTNTEFRIEAIKDDVIFSDKSLEAEYSFLPKEIEKIDTIKKVSVRFDNKRVQGSFVIKVFEQVEGIDFGYVIDIFFDSIDVLDSLLSLRTDKVFISKKSYNILKGTVLGRNFIYEEIRWFGIEPDKPYDLQIMEKFDSIFKYQKPNIN